MSFNDLTIENLKQRVKELETQLGDCRSKISDKQTSIIQQETELATVKFKTDPSSINRMFNVKKVMDGLKKDVNELRCVEQKLSKQLELIQKPLREHGKEKFRQINLTILQLQFHEIFQVRTLFPMDVIFPLLMYQPAKVKLNDDL